jgi:hypothetical protein
MEFSFSMDATPRVAIDTNAPLYASVPGSATDLGSGECVLRTLDGETHAMTIQVLQALDRCRPFLTLAEHAQAVRQVIPSAPPEGIARVLDSLIARRLLVSEKDFVAKLQTQAATAAPLHLVIRCGDRAEGAVRLLQSLGEQRDWRDRIGTVTLLSAATQADVRAAQQAALDGFAAAADRRAGLVAAADLRATLRKSLAGDGAVLDPLFATSAAIGSAQSFNLALPLLAGRRVLLLDDESVWPLRRHAEYRRGIELRGVDRTDARFHGSLAEALAAGGADPGSELLREHDLACGAPLGSLLAVERESGWRAGDLRGIGIADIHGARGDADIVATLSGRRGALRALAVEDFYTLDGESSASFGSDRERYLAQLQRAWLWNGSRRAALANVAHDWPLTIDARGFLPFALPGGNAAAQSFTALLRLARPQSLLLHRPDAIGQAEAGALAQRLQTAAALLDDLAASTPAALADFASEYLQFVRGDLVHRLQRATEEAGADAPVHWLADLRAIVTVNGRALVQPGAPRLDGDGGEGERFAPWLAERLRATSAAMRAWPALWDRLVDMAARGSAA